MPHLTHAPNLTHARRVHREEAEVGADVQHHTPAAVVADALALQQLVEYAHDAALDRARVAHVQADAVVEIGAAQAGEPEKGL
eukprot:206181-Chlamydomonas_euryale.AAC.3